MTDVSEHEGRQRPPAAGRHLDADGFAQLLVRIHDLLSAHRDEIDDLNVFPVPDGDTGTNMTATVRAALDALADSDHDDDAARAGAVVRAAVRGARGNSGVVLSQVLRAVVEATITGRVDTAGYAQLLAVARDLAYDAVADPVEGTILTVIDVAAQRAVEAAADGDELEAAAAAVRDAVAAAVTATETQLDALARAGVVDAGARGFELVVAAVHDHLAGASEHTALPLASPARSRAGCRHDAASDYRYEVQYLLEGTDDAAPLRQALRVLGDSITIAASDGLLAVHVHTDDAGGAVEEGLRFGRPSDISIVDLDDQVAARQAVDDERRDRRALGCVAVLPGGGPADLGRELGAEVVVGAGGNLPTVADLLNAVGDVDAAEVVLLPGHRNVVATARQASAVSVAEGGRDLSVADTALSPPAVLAALAVCDPAAQPDRVLGDMHAAAEAVRAGEVVAAIRDADTPVGAVVAGQLLTVVDGEVVATDHDPLAALRALLEACGAGDAEVATLVVSTDVGADERATAERLVVEVAPDVELDVIVGAAPPSRYWLGVE